MCIFSGKMRDLFHKLSQGFSLNKKKQVALTAFCNFFYNLVVLTTSAFYACLSNPPSITFISRENNIQNLSNGIDIISAAIQKFSFSEFYTNCISFQKHTLVRATIAENAHILAKYLNHSLSMATQKYLADSYHIEHNEITKNLNSSSFFKLSSSTCFGKDMANWLKMGKKFNPHLEQSPKDLCKLYKRSIMKIVSTLLKKEGIKCTW